MGKVEIKKYKKRDVIIAEGDNSRTIYKILSGKVLQYSNYGKPNEFLVQAKSGMDYLGEMAFAGGQPSVYTSVACTDVTTLCIPEEALGDYVNSDPRRMQEILKTLAKNVSFLGEVIKGLADSHKVDTYMTYRRKVEEAAPFDVNAAALSLRQDGDSVFSDVEELQGDAVLFGANDDAAEEMPPEDPRQDLGLFPQGHKGYPGIIHPEYCAHLYEKTYTCPHCGRKFQAIKPFYGDATLVATTNPDASPYELRIFYKDFEAEWYEIVTCTHCYFSGLDEAFKVGRSIFIERFQKKLLEIRKELRLDFLGERTLDFVFAQHYLAMICARGFSDYRQTTAHYWMNLKWLYQSIGDRSMTDMAEKETLAAYQRVFAECALEPKQEQYVCLMIANLLLQQGNLRGAQQWAYNTRAKRGLGNAAYANLAERIIGDIREELDRLALLERKLQREAEEL